MRNHMINDNGSKYFRVGLILWTSIWIANQLTILRRELTGFMALHFCPFTYKTCVNFKLFCLELADEGKRGDQFG